jgi:glycosyltransferase involved in cell wall biosynthesis
MDQTELPARLGRAAAHAAGGRKVRVLHSVGHLARGGIENWLYQMVQRLDPERFEHHVLVWTEEEEAFTAQFRAVGARVLPCTGHTRPHRLAANFARLLREHGPYDVLHAHGSHGHAFVMLFAALAGIRARVAHSHCDVRPVLREAGPAYRLYAAIGNRLMRSLLTVGAAVAVEAAESLFGKAWSSDPRIRILHCGIDMRPFHDAPDPELRVRLGIPAGRAVIGHVGRFEEQKNHAFLLDIAAAAAERGSPLHFLLIGDGSLRPGFIATMRARGLADRFTLVDDCPTIPAHMIGAMDCFVCPSLFEGLPLVLMEAQAAGLPCVVSEGLSRDVGQHTDLIRRLPLERGAAAWAETLEAMPAQRIDSRDPVLRQRMDRCSFNVETSAAGLSVLYDAALATAGGRVQAR